MPDSPVPASRKKTAPQRGDTMIWWFTRIFRAQKITVDCKNKRMEIITMEGDRTYINDYAPETVNLKTYVSVRAYFNTEGIIMPDLILWEDGRRFKIDRILEKRPAASLKSGGTGIRYTCLICNREAYLYLDGSKWWVEKRRNIYKPYR